MTEIEVKKEPNFWLFVAIMLGNVYGILFLIIALLHCLRTLIGHE